MSLYSIWVLEYSYVPDYARSMVIYGAHNQGIMRLPYCYVVIKGPSNLIMVDVGYSHRDWGKEMAEKLGVKGWQNPRHVLAKIGFTPEQVDTVLLTHLHFDHAGNLEEFPNARVVVQEREVTKNVWAMSLPPRMAFLSFGVDPGDVLKCVELGRRGRITLVDGDVEDFFPGIDLRVAYDTHTYGSMYIVVRNDGERKSNDPWILTGDLLYVYENILEPLTEDGKNANSRAEKFTPVGFAVGSNTNLILATEEIMKAANRDVNRLVMVHEQRLGEKFPSRLDDDGLSVVEVCLADGERSRVR